MKDTKNKEKNTKMWKYVQICQLRCMALYLTETDGQADPKHDLAPAVSGAASVKTQALRPGAHLQSRHFRRSDRRSTRALEFKTRLGNIVRPPSLQKIKNGWVWWHL